jgi:hypothetical protein
VGDQLLGFGGEDRDLAHSEPLAEFDEARFAYEIGGFGPSQEVYVEVGCHRLSDETDIGEDRYVERHVSQPEHAGAGDRAARAQVHIVDDEPHPRAHRADVFDEERAADLRKFLGEKIPDVGSCEDGGRHNSLHQHFNAPPPNDIEESQRRTVGPRLPAFEL